MSPLERRCRLLLRPYPAACRRDRGEEILGTLLEITPAGRSWPRARDARSLTFAGLRERAAHNTRVTTAANVRTAALIGVAAYLAFSIAGYLSVLILSELETGQAELSPATAGEIVVASFLAGTVVLAWVSRRRILVLAGAVPAAAAVCYAGPWRPWLIGGIVTLLICLAALTVLAGGTERPSRRWLWLIGPSQPSSSCLVSGPHTGQRPTSCCWWRSPVPASSGPRWTPGRPSRSRWPSCSVSCQRWWMSSGWAGALAPKCPCWRFCASSLCWRCGDCARSRHTSARHETQWWRATSFPDERSWVFLPLPPGPLTSGRGELADGLSQVDAGHRRDRDDGGVQAGCVVLGDPLAALLG